MNGLTISPLQWKSIYKHLEACLPEEGCGLLGGRHGRVMAVCPVTNALHSPVRFRMVPEEQLKAFLWFEQHEMELVGIFHSHPNGPRHPSGTDLAQFAYPDVVSLICWPAEGSWEAKGFWMDGKSYHEVPVVIGAEGT